MFFCIAIMILTVIADQTTKLLIVNSLELGESAPLIPGVFNFTYIRNRGAAFGMLSEHRWIFMAMSVLLIAFLIIYLIKAKPQSKIVRLCLALIVGGGIGNMIDRVIYGFVIDFLDFELIHFYIFNVADAAVTVGCAGLVTYILFHEFSEQRIGSKTK